MSCLIYLEISDTKELAIYYKKRNYYFICMRYLLVTRITDFHYVDALAKEVRTKKNVKMIKTIKPSSFSLWDDHGEHIYMINGSLIIIGAVLIGSLLSVFEQEQLMRELSYNQS